MFETVRSNECRRMDSFEISSKFSVIKTTSKGGNPIAKGISRLVALFFPGSFVSGRIVVVDPFPLN